MKPYVFSIGGAFGELAASDPHQPALRLASGTITTYRELDDDANRLAAVFSSRGLRRRDVLGIVHTKTPLSYAAMLAALKLGAAYVNLDDQNPPPRLAHIFETARPAFIFAEHMPGTVRNVATQLGAAVIERNDIAAELHEAPVEEPAQTRDVVGSDPAYIMYTSGSTGVPKGALMTHANVLNFARWAGARFGIGPQDTLTNVNPMYFDNSVFDFYGGLLNGAAIAPIPRETLADGVALVNAVEAAGCTIWFSVPSLLIYLTTLKLLHASRLPTIRTFAFGGEGYPKPELRKLFETFSSRARIVNVYGPTECTCICSAWDVRGSDLDDMNGLVTLGPLADNFFGLVLDGNEPVGPGEVGELCLLGPQVGLGYVNDAQRTADAFVQNPLNARFAERMYRTGDLVKLGGDGRMLDFVGRKDNQIKHMGYRIELEEIEAAINQLKGVSQSAVLQREGRRGQRLLVAYVASEIETNEATVRNALAELLPPYMIPQRVVVREALPKNANGKVDRIALRAEELE
jgi:D-alanine--poly(phosphoribitol) ligase subunit 1